MIEVETAQIVLVGLALAAVLADDHPRHRLEHFAGAHDRPGLQLSGRDRTLARRRGNADQILGGILDLGEVAERRGASNDDVGIQCERQHRIHSRRSAGRHEDLPPQHGVVDQPEGELGAPDRHDLEPIVAGAVSNRGQLARARQQIDRYPGQSATGLIDDPTRHAAVLLGASDGGADEQHPER